MSTQYRKWAIETLEAATNRADWEDKNRTYYEMRYHGLPRQNKPFATAADMHFPQVDSTIRKKKPFLTLAVAPHGFMTEFYAKTEQAEGLTTGAAQFLDYQLRYESDFEDKFSFALTASMLRGRGILGGFMDPLNGHRLWFDSPDPMLVICEDHGADLEDADWFVIVRHMTVDAYRRNRRLNQDKGVIERIRGRSQEDWDEWMRDSRHRQGLSLTTNKDLIVVHERWQKTMEGHTVCHYSPSDPDAFIRTPYGNPIKWDGQESFPYVTLPQELEEPGYYAPRGMAELVAPFESYLCKLWNEKIDYMSYVNRPMWTSNKNTQINGRTIKFAPGEHLPGDAQFLRTNAPPVSFDQEIMQTRALSEEYTRQPDFGVQNPNAKGGEPRTAAENNRIAGLQDVGSTYDVGILRRRLRKLYQHTWALNLFYKEKRKQWAYLAEGSWKQLSVNAVHDGYLIVPAGDSEAWNRDKRFNQSLLMFQTGAGHPNFNQEELARDVIRANDPAKEHKLFISTQAKMSSEAEDEAVEIVLLMNGFPAVVEPHEDHVTRIGILIGKMEQLGQMGVPVDPLARKRLQEHLAVHLQILQATQPEVANELMQKLMQVGMNGNGQQPGQMQGPQRMNQPAQPNNEPV